MFGHFLHNLQKVDAGEKVPPGNVGDDFDFFAVDHLDSVCSAWGGIRFLGCGTAAGVE